MRKIAAVLLCSLSCSHNLRSVDPANWVELQSEHFVLRTDLPATDARKAISDFELVRAALLEMGWKSNRPAAERTQVVELASARELREFAREGIEGFVISRDAFGDPLMVVSAAHDVIDQEIVKHELTHVINGGFLVSRPRWVDEGIACYLETLQFDRRKNQVVVGIARPERLEFLSRFKMHEWTAVISTGREFEGMSAESGYGFETQAWLLVHWLADTDPERFDRFITRLAHGENQAAAFSAEFPGMSEEKLDAGLRAYSRKGGMGFGTGPMPSWSGAIAVRGMGGAEVFALRAQLAKFSPGDGTPASRAQKAKAEAVMALSIDAGEPLALALLGESDGSAATSAHPDDWRAWVLRHEHSHDLASIESAFRLAPESAGVLLRLAFAEGSAGKAERALAHAARAVEIAPGRSDVLDAFSQALGANGRCEEAHAAELRAINALPDEVSPDVPASLRARLRQLDDNCRKPQQEVAQQPAPQKQVDLKQTPQQAVSRSPILKSCRSEPPLGNVKGALVAEFTIEEDGAVSGVSIKGEASEPFLAAFKRYLEGCRFEPVMVGGKPRMVHSSTTLTKVRARR